MIIGICGGTCSGKTTICNTLKQFLGNTVSIISLDNYYIPHTELSLKERMMINYDEPSSIDFVRLLEDIKMIKSGKSIVQPFFSFETFLNEETNVITSPNKIIDMLKPPAMPGRTE